MPVSIEGAAADALPSQLLELHEHEVPDLDEAVAVRSGEPGGRPDLSPWS
jgi:hypothetical protein